jgi:hypothetical protein
MCPETKTEPTVAVALNLPRSIAAQLDALAQEWGKDREAVVIQLLQNVKPLTLADVVGPVHEEFRQKGMNSEEVDAWAEAEVKAHREGR